MKVPAPKSSPVQVPSAPSPGPTHEQHTPTIPTLSKTEPVIQLESQQLILEVGKESGAIRHVTLKRFRDAIGSKPIRFGHEAPILSLIGWQQGAQVHFAAASNTQAEFDVVEESINYHILYKLDPINSLLTIELTSENPLPDRFQLLLVWNKGDGLSDQHNRLEASLATAPQHGKQVYSRISGPFRKEKSVPRGTTILSLADRYFCLSARPETGHLGVTFLPSQSGTIAASASLVTASSGAEPARCAIDAYFGPRGHTYLERVGFGNAFQVGFLGHIGLALLWVLGGIAKLTKNYGIAIVLFSALVTCVTAPFTLLGYRSMKRIQELKPQVDEIMTKFKGDLQRANREVFALYKKHRVSPLGGCLPLLLQMPIFIALLAAISHDIELRGKSFLWIDDLSLPDRVATLPMTLPLLGADLNLLPIIMAFAMFLQSRLTQKGMPTDKSNPAAALMSGPLMSILFGIMFYQFPAGLVLYWLTNSLISVAWYKLAS